MADSDPLNHEAPTPPFRILFEDTHLLVLSKAPGILSQGDASGDPSLVDLLRSHFGRNYVGLIHRLDRNTSGLMVVAKRSKSAERLTAQLQSGELQREYHAVLWGELTGPPTQKWEHWLLKNPQTNEVKVVPPGAQGAKKAVLLAQLVRIFHDPRSDRPLSWVRFQLETGRSHQIRVQARAMGFPLIGDIKYGTPLSASLFSRPALHSCFLSFIHPMSQEPMLFEEPLPQDLVNFCKSTLTY
jgi:23S rRNA pseudouridine1911/1915/1917 synthase